MLEFFRKHARGWFMLVFMAIIIFVFVLYFGTDRGSRTASALAVMDGKIISETEYHNEYSKMMDMIKARYGSALTEDMIKKMDLKKAAYDNLINRQIIIAKAGDLKLQVTDDELRQAIMKIPALQTDGKFDISKYKQLLRYNRMTAEDFEAGQKISLAAGKIESIIREGIKVSDQEVLDLYTLQNQKINLRFVQITGADMARRVNLTTSDLENYLKKNNNAFRIPDQVKIKYLHFGAEMFASGEIPPSEIRDYYDRRKDHYKDKSGKPLGLVQASPEIIREIRKNQGMQTAFTEAKKAHDTIYQEQNFDQYAAKHHLNIKTADFFTLNSPPPALASIKDLPMQLAGLEKKDISKVLTAGDGYFLLYVEDKKSAYTPPLKSIENDVRQQYIREEQDRLATTEAAALMDKLKKGESLDKLATEKSLHIQETGWFQPGGEIPKIGSSPDAMEMLLTVSLNKPYPEKPLKINNIQFIFKLQETSSLDMKDFEAKKELYRNVAINLKREEIMKSWLEGNKTAMIQEKRLKINKELKDL
ncbi:MAG: SurA N-terminal domain-containing protein [Syntrophaceae bacterium]|jgi:peptidyl-prolyl cis-trans isomerase D|nr:SurA N-terminal domain-containing protein [Syntrophaceae bacterium]